MNAIQTTIDGTVDRLIQGVLMVPLAIGFVLLAIVVVWYAAEHVGSGR